MEQTTVAGSLVKRQRHRSRQEVFTIMEEFEKAPNISPQKFANKHQISTATFYHWQKKYKSKDTNKRQPQEFIPVSIAPESIDARPPGIFAEVNGKAIRFYQWVEPSYLKKLLS